MDYEFLHLSPRKGTRRIISQVRINERLHHPQYVFASAFANVEYGGIRKKLFPTMMTKMETAPNPATNQGQSEAPATTTNLYN